MLFTSSFQFVNSLLVDSMRVDSIRIQWILYHVVKNTTNAEIEEFFFPFYWKIRDIRRLTLTHNKTNSAEETTRVDEKSTCRNFPKKFALGSDCKFK